MNAYLVHVITDSLSTGAFEVEAETLSEAYTLADARVPAGCDYIVWQLETAEDTAAREAAEDAAQWEAYYEERREPLDDHIYAIDDDIPF